MPDVQVHRPQRQRDERMGEVSKPPEPPAREQRLEKRTGEPQDDEERADVADQQVLRHVAEEKLLAHVRERREKRRRSEQQPSREAEDPPRRDRPALPREREGAERVGGAGQGEGGDLKRLEDAAADMSKRDHVHRRTA